MTASNAPFVTVAAVALAVIAATGGLLWRRLRAASLPPHPERRVVDDEHTDFLAELHDELWPNEEHRGAYHCPLPAEPVYDTPDEAFNAIPGRMTTLCVCGGYHHIRPARRRRTQKGSKR